MSYNSKNSRTYVKVKDDSMSVTARAYCNHFDDTYLTFGGVETKGGIEGSFDGIGVRGEVDAHILKVEDFKSKTAVKAFAISVKANGGLDMKALTEKDKIIGFESKAKGTLVECKAGHIFLHLGAGVSNTAEVEDGTFDGKFCGSGGQIGKHTGVFVFDNKLSVKTLSIVGKG